MAAFIVEQPPQSLESISDRFTIFDLNPNTHHCASYTADAMPVEREFIA